MTLSQDIVLLMTLLALAYLVTWAFVKGQPLMKAKIARQIDWGINQGRIKLEIDGTPKSAKEMYAVICSKDYPQK